MKKFYYLLPALLMGVSVLPASAAETMPPATLTFPSSTEFIEVPSMIEFRWGDEIVELTEPQESEWGDLYTVGSVAFDDGEPMEVDLVYMYFPPYYDEDGTLAWAEEAYLSAALYELDYDFSEASKIVLSIPAGIVKNKEGLLNEAQEIILTKSPYADLEYSYDYTADPEEESEIPEGDAVIRISYGGNRLAYLAGDIFITNLTDFTMGNLYYGKEVSINEENELVIDLSGYPAAEYEITVPDAFLLITADDAQYLSGGFYYAFTIVEDESDAIKSLEAGKAEGKTFTIRGERVSSENLAPGLYIKDGKKIIVK